jgi:hypothetical protein
MLQAQTSSGSNNVPLGRPGNQDEIPLTPPMVGTQIFNNPNVARKL